MQSLSPEVVQTKSFILIDKVGEEPRVYPILPKGYYTKPEFEIWKRLMKLGKRRKLEVLHKWLHFLHKLHRREAEALELWIQIKEIKQNEWERVWVIPSESVIALFTILEGKILGRLAWRRKKC